MIRTGLFLLTILAHQSASALAVPAAGEKGNCIYDVTPSSITAVQANRAAVLDGTACTDYTQVCFTLDDVSTQLVHISTWNASVAEGGTISARASWPVFGATYHCFDWG